MPSDLNRYASGIFPDASQYTQGFVGALDWLGPIATMPPSAGGILTSPVGMQVMAFKSAIQSAVGKDWKEIRSIASDIVTLAGSPIPEKVVSVTSDLVANSLKVVVDQLGHISDSVEGVTNVLDAVPFIGAVASAVVNYGVAFALIPEVKRQAAAACRGQLRQQMNTLCQSEYIDTRPTGAGITVTPADMFRPLFYGPNGRLTQFERPMTVASLFVALCGSQTQGFVLPPGQSPSAVHTHVHYGGAAWNGPFQWPSGQQGIDQETQRRMWALIKSIRDSAMPPTFIYSPHNGKVGDDGRFAMSMLLDIVWNEWDKGHIDMSTLNAASNWVTAVHQFDGTDAGCATSKTIGGITTLLNPAETWETCAGWNGVPVVDLATPLFSILQLYGDNMRKLFFDTKTGTWRFTPNPGASEMFFPGLLAKKPTGLLVLDSSQALSLSKTAAAVQSGQVAWTPGQRTAAAASTAAVLGGGAFWLARRAAKRKR